MFSSRSQAGKILGKKLRVFSQVNPVVLGITRGGVVVAAEVAKILRAPLYPLVIKKIGHPENPEYAIGAMGPEGDVVISDKETVNSQQIEEIRKKIEKRKKLYNILNTKYEIQGKTAVIVDDGMATGLTMKAALRFAQAKQPKKIIVAVPVADREVVQKLQLKYPQLKIIVLEEVVGLGAVGNYYADFSEVTDEEVRELLLY